MCGGTYRRAKKIGQKRKSTYAEQKQKRKERLFGKGEGDSLGSSQDVRADPEKVRGKGTKSNVTKPRVAQSQRGRELRAEAALRRMAAQVREADPDTDKVDTEEDTEEDENEDVEEDTVDVGGGNRLVKVEEGSNNQEDWKQILNDMNLLCATTASPSAGSSAGPALHHSTRTKPSISESKGKGVKHEPSGRNRKAEGLDIDTASESSLKGSHSKPPLTDSGNHELFKPTPATPQARDTDSDSATEDSDNNTVLIPSLGSAHSKTQPTISRTAMAGKLMPSLSPAPNLKEPPSYHFPLPRHSLTPVQTSLSPAQPNHKLLPQIVCTACTTENYSSSTLCDTCGNVLDRKWTSYWICSSQNCATVGYAVSQA